MNHTPARHVAPRQAPTRGPAHARSLRRHSVVRAVGMVATAVVAFAGVGAATAAVTLTGNIRTVDADAALGTDRPEVVAPEDPSAGSPLNILLLGSDSRGGDNADVVGDGVSGARSDTTMVMHLSADRSRVELMSIPRDTTIDVPACPTSSGGETAPMYGVKFNAAFAQGVMTGGDVESGALCTMKAIETISDVFMDGFIVVDFAGFENMIESLGGVEMCIPNDISSKKADNLVLEAGMQTLDGETALKYARARTGEGLGDGSDIGRIGRQQELMAALARTVLGQNLLTDSPQLLQFLGAVTGSLTMSSNLGSMQGLAGLAYSARGVRPDTIAFMTVPWQYDPSNPNNVVLTEEATTVFDNLRNDRPLSDVIEEPKDEASKDGGGEDASDDGTEKTSEDESAEEAPEPSEDEPAADETEEPTTETAAEDESADEEPEPAETREAGEEAFTSADVTSVCG
ncbi:LCP family protein [Isoptericola halotolerans]|uniref:LCP family protein n=1 Tax=Isoptericola halotolerans TaxID=300560 RepID=UPI00389113C0